MNRIGENIQPRERVALILGALAAAGLVFYLLVWAPFGVQRAGLENRLEEQRALLGWMQAAAAQVQALRARGERPAGSADESLLALVERTARGAGLADSIRRIRPEGARGVGVRLEDAAFDGVLRWLGDLTRDGGLSVTQLEAQRAAAAGRVNVTLRLQAGGP